MWLRRDASPLCQPEDHIAVALVPPRLPHEARPSGLVRQNRDRFAPGIRLARQDRIPSEDQAVSARHSASAVERLCL
jgi:hypothetical protein